MAAPRTCRPPRRARLRGAPALGDARDTLVGWGCYSLHGRYRPGGGTWTEPWTISPDSGVDVLESASAVVAPGGDVAVVWDQEELPLKVRVLSVS